MIPTAIIRDSLKQNVDFEPNSMAEHAKTQKPLVTENQLALAVLLIFQCGMALSQNGDKVQKDLVFGSSNYRRPSRFMLAYRHLYGHTLENALALILA